MNERRRWHVRHVGVGQRSAMKIAAAQAAGWRQQRCRRGGAVRLFQTAVRQAKVRQEEEAVRRIRAQRQALSQAAGEATCGTGRQERVTTEGRHRGGRGSMVKVDVTAPDSTVKRSRQYAMSYVRSRYGVCVVFATSVRIQARQESSTMARWPQRVAVEGGWRRSSEVMSGAIQQMRRTLCRQAATSRRRRNAPSSRTVMFKRMSGTITGAIYE